MAESLRDREAAGTTQDDFAADDLDGEHGLPPRHDAGLHHGGEQVEGSRRPQRNGLPLRRRLSGAHSKVGGNPSACGTAATTTRRRYFNFSATNRG